MDAVTASPTGNVDTVNASPLPRCDVPLQSPDRSPVSSIAQQRTMRAGAFGPPVRRSPRQPFSPPPQPSIECQDTQDTDESGDDESESVNDVALHLSRGETPENDTLPPDEPSMVLADRIIRAYDNPSPPPQDLAYPGINCVPGKDGQFPPPRISVPPSPFRSTNFLERLNQLSDPPFGPSYSVRTSILVDQPETSKPGIASSRGIILPESCSPFIASVSMTATPHEDLASADTIASSPIKCTVDDLPSRSTQHVCEPAHTVNDAGIGLSSQSVAGQSITSTTSLGPKVFSPSQKQVIDSPLNPVAPPALDGRPRGPLTRSEQLGYHQPSPVALNTTTLLPPLSNEIGDALSATETTALGGRDNNGEEISPTGNSSVPVPSGQHEVKCRATSRKEVDANLYQRLNHPPHSTNVLAGPCLALESTSSIDQIIIASDSIPIQHPPATPSQTPRPSATHSSFSRSTIQLPAISSTPVRANNSARKLNSPVKFHFEVDGIHRTPAKRVLIETALPHRTPSLRKNMHVSTASDQPQPGRFLTIRPPVFTRPALEDPSRSPAKRIPVTDSVASPTKGDLGPPMRLSLRTRGASVETPPLRPVLARSRSAEPCAMISKPDNLGKTKESIFPMVPTLPRPATKLPFPLVPGQKSSSDVPSSIPEEHETTVIGNTETDATLGTVAQGNVMSQLRQPPTNSRIPRIGNKPYARPPPKNGKAIATANMARARGVPPIQPACKNNWAGNGDTEESSTQPANAQSSVGSLKRKRGVAATTPSNPYPVMIRQVVPGILGRKYAPKPAKSPSRVQSPSESNPPKVPPPLKFRKVVDGMLSARYPPTKAILAQSELLDSISHPLSPLSELSSSSNEEFSDEKILSTAHTHEHPKSETFDIPRTDASVVGPSAYERSSLHHHADGDDPSSRLRRTPRTRKPAQQQYVLDVFSGNAPTRPPPARRKPQPRTECDGFLGMSATALRVLTASNTTKNQQTVAVLSTEVIRKEGLRPESPTVKARTILQKQRDERDTRRRERAQRRARMSEEGSGVSDTEGQTKLGDRASLGVRADCDENDRAMPPKHLRGPGDEEDYETPERPERILEPLKLEGMDTKVRPVKQVKWHRGLSTAVYLDGVDPQPKSLRKDVIVARGCLAHKSKNIPLDPLGNIVDTDNRRSPDPVMERIVVKRYLYDNDIEPEPIPTKITRSKSKKGRN